MIHTQSAPPAPERLAHRDHRIALAAGGLFMALLVVLTGTRRAFAVPASAPRDSAPIAAARRTVAPVQAPAPSTTVAPAPPAHTAPVVAGQEATVEIPSIGVSLPIVRGGQDVIDRGVAAHYTGPQWRPPTDPGRPGTYWLAAHNSTHGSPFESLPAIANGAEVRITNLDGTVFTYLVTSRDLVGTSTTLATVYGNDTSIPRLLLQTCEGAAQRLLVHGTLTSVTSG